MSDAQGLIAIAPSGCGPKIASTILIRGPDAMLPAPIQRLQAAFPSAFAAIVLASPLSRLG